MFQMFTERFTSKNYPSSRLKTEASYHQLPTSVTPGLGWLRQRLFGISTVETTFARRGFRGGEAKAQQRLEQIGRTFLRGYHAAITFGTAQGAIAHDNPEALVPQLNAVEAELRGFAFEGAAMGLALLDYLTPWKRNRVQLFLTGAGANHVYMVHVGVGWLLARIPFGIQQYLARLDRKAGIRETNPKSLDPLLGWLAVDGYGFHEGYFHASRYVEWQVIPKGISDYARRVFDQGLGRSLWFVLGADVTRISVTLQGFHPMRRADLWSGLGLACAYAGGVDSAAIEALRTAAGSYLPQLAQGAAFAAKARQRAGNPAIHTEIACEVLCGMSAEAAAEITDIALENLPTDGVLPAYEVWRQRIQNQFAAEGVQA
jgi:hypothetical protein